MSCVEPPQRDPIVGDLLVAQQMMRAWETDVVRGSDGPYINEGQQALLIQTWVVGNQRRLRVFFKDRVLLFSSAEHCLHRNWQIALDAP